MSKKDNFIFFPLHLLDAPFKQSLNMIAGWGIYKLGCWKYWNGHGKVHDLDEGAAIDLGLNLVSEHLKGDYAVSFDKPDLLAGLEAARKHKPYYEGTEPPAPTIRLDLFFDACARKPKLKERDFRVYAGLISIIGQAPQKKINRTRLHAAACGIKKGCNRHPVPESHKEYIKSEKVVRGAIDSLKKRGLITSCLGPSKRDAHFSHRLSQHELENLVRNLPRNKRILTEQKRKRNDNEDQRHNTCAPSPETQRESINDYISESARRMRMDEEQQARDAARKKRERDRLRNDILYSGHPQDVVLICHKHNWDVNQIQEYHYDAVRAEDYKGILAARPRGAA